MESLRQKYSNAKLFGFDSKWTNIKSGNDFYKWFIILIILFISFVTALCLRLSKPIMMFNNQK